MDRTVSDSQTHFRLSHSVTARREREREREEQEEQNFLFPILHAFHIIYIYIYVIRLSATQPLLKMVTHPLPFMSLLISLYVMPFIDCQSSFLRYLKKSGWFNFCEWSFFFLLLMFIISQLKRNIFCIIFSSCSFTCMQITN